MRSLKYFLLGSWLAIAPLWGTDRLLAQTTIAQATVAQATVAQATQTERATYRQQQERQIRPENFDLQQHPLNDAKEDFWRNILWTTAIVEPQENYVAQALAQLISFTRRSNLSNAQTRTIDMAMQVGTQLYLGNPTIYANLQQSWAQTIEQSSDPVWVAMAFSALVQSGLDGDLRQQWISYIQQRFPQWTEDVYLYSTLKDAQATEATVPPLKDLLNWTIAPNQPHLYVLCRPDRGTLCQTVLKDKAGKFVQQDGKLWTVPLLLRSIHNLSWIFTRGQTPQGIYRIEGTVPQPDQSFFRAYGLFPLVKLFVPFEAGVQEFVPGQRGPLTGGLNAYQAMLPPSWHNYFPIQQTYWAGKAGRSLFRIHGSGESPEFFSNNQFYPNSQGWNPTIGCLSALELYDNTGRLQQADMPKIIDALKSIAGTNFTGYLVVVDVPGDANTPITTEEIEAAIGQ